MKTDSVYVKKAQIFQALSHPVRLHILDALRSDEACVCHLQELIVKPQAYISQQLRILKDAGIVKGRRDGMQVYYSINSAIVFDVLALVLGKTKPKVILSDCRCSKCN